MANNFSFGFERANPLSREVMSMRPQRVWNSIQLMDRARQARLRTAAQAASVATAGQNPLTEYKPELNASSTVAAEVKMSVPVAAPAQTAPVETGVPASSNTASAAVRYESQQQLYDEAVRMLGEIHGPADAAAGTGADDA